MTPDGLAAHPGLAIGSAISVLIILCAVFLDLRAFFLDRQYPSHWIFIILAVMTWANFTWVLQWLLPRWDNPDYWLSTRVTPIVQVILLSFALRAHYLAINTIPGRVPASWQQRIGQPDSDDSYGSWPPDKSYCSVCGHYKPSRCHHCSVCKKCVLRYDHHCPWMDNCVGFYNHKFFLLITLYYPIACWVLVISSWHLGASCTGMGLMLSDVTVDCPLEGVYRINFILVFWFIMALAVACTIFSTRNWFMLCRNQTTCEAQYLPHLQPCYDLGCMNNARSVLGPRVWTWLLPTTEHVPDFSKGIHFQHAVAKQQYDMHGPPRSAQAGSYGAFQGAPPPNRPDMHAAGAQHGAGAPPGSQRAAPALGPDDAQWDALPAEHCYADWGGLE
eukprot:TRINITY_DN1479_c0_g1_i1.p1 TRINITY_DN1479_c0_g1~~TRINITY_DN1479_c0_g1_i1.p1  ORF type:complete len:425 (+),score=95.76 TRINITY_DN1479_c0_g1_i1:113-1276(+)